MRSLYMRVFLVTIYTIAVSSFIGFIIANAYYNLELKSYNDNRMFAAADNIRAYIGQYPETMGEFLEQTASLGYQIYVTDAGGSDIFFGGEFRKRDLSPAIRDSVLSGTEYHGIAKHPNKLFATSYFDNRLSNTVGVLLEAGTERYALFLRHDTRLQFDELRTFFVLLFVFTVLISIPYFLLSTRYLVQSIVRLTEATKRISQGIFRLKLPTGRKDEIGQLATHFQSMALQLERSDQEKKDFVANVSHEIQSPLASIQGFADSIIRENPDNGRINHYAAIIGQETRRLAALGRQLLLLSTLDNATEAVDKRAFLLQPQLRQTLQLLEWQIAEKEIAVRLSVPAKLEIRGDKVLLMQVWSNLLSNAVQHIPEGRSIEIRAYLEEGACVVAIGDTGDGIAKDKLPYIFERFYSGDSARQRDKGNTGLGLSIVQRIVRLHGGTVEAESTVGKGSVFRIRIPV